MADDKKSKNLLHLSTWSSVITNRSSSSARTGARSAVKRPLAARPVDLTDEEFDAVVDDVMENTSVARDILSK